MDITGLLARIGLQVDGPATARLIDCLWLLHHAEYVQRQTSRLDWGSLLLQSEPDEPCSTVINPSEPGVYLKRIGREDAFLPMHQMLQSLPFSIGRVTVLPAIWQPVLSGVESGEVYRVRQSAINLARRSMSVEALTGLRMIVGVGQPVSQVVSIPRQLRPVGFSQAIVPVVRIQPTRTIARQTPDSSQNIIFFSVRPRIDPPEVVISNMYECMQLAPATVTSDDLQERPDCPVTYQVHKTGDRAHRCNGCRWVFAEGVVREIMQREDTPRCPMCRGSITRMQTVVIG